MQNDHEHHVCKRVWPCDDQAYDAPQGQSAASLRERGREPFGVVAAAWLDSRHDLKPRTRAEHANLLSAKTRARRKASGASTADLSTAATFGDRPVNDITRADIAGWVGKLAKAGRVRSVQAAATDRIWQCRNATPTTIRPQVARGWVAPIKGSSNGWAAMGSRSVRGHAAAMVAITVVVLGLSTVRTAKADPDPFGSGDKDTVFLAQLVRNGLSSSDGGGNAIRVANTICSGLAAGKTPKQAFDYVVSNTGLGMTQAANFTKISMRVYCPQFLSKIGPNGVSGSGVIG